MQQLIPKVRDLALGRADIATGYELSVDMVVACDRSWPAAQLADNRAETLVGGCVALATYPPEGMRYAGDGGSLARGWKYSGWLLESMSWKTGALSTSESPDGRNTPLRERQPSSA